MCAIFAGLWHHLVLEVYGVVLRCVDTVVSEVSRTLRKKLAVIEDFCYLWSVKVIDRTPTKRV